MGVRELPNNQVRKYPRNWKHLLKNCLNQQIILSDFLERQDKAAAFKDVNDETDEIVEEIKKDSEAAKSIEKGMKVLNMVDEKDITNSDAKADGSNDGATDRISETLILLTVILLV